MKLDISKLMGSETEEAGFVWEEGEVQYEPDGDSKTKVSLGVAPHTRVVDVAKFEENFPGVILAALNGTSIKVACQAVTRRALIRDRKTTDESMRTAVLNALRGIKNRGAVVVKREFIAFGKSFATQELANAFVREFLGAKGLDEDTINDILADAVEVTESE